MEEKQIPRIAVSAIIMAQAGHQRLMNDLAEQTLEVMGLPSGEGWTVFVDEGVARKKEPEKSATE
jgi:hypothetical protein